MEKSKKYPISKQGYQCIGPCYKIGTIVTHPHAIVTKKLEKNQCPIMSRLLFDDCDIPTASEDINKYQDMNIIVPSIYFDTEQFLKIYYNIHSYNEGVKWIEENKTVNIYTKLRIMECLITSYNTDILYIDDAVINLYIDWANLQWIKDIYNTFEKNVDIKDENIIIVNNSKLKFYDHIEERKKFLLNKFINKNNMNKIILRHLESIKTKPVASNNIGIFQQCILFIEEKINKILKK